MQESQGKAVERWVRAIARKHYLISQKSFELEQVVKLLDTNLQRRLMFARMYIDQELPYANDWLDRILSNKRLPQGASVQAKADLVEKLLDQVLATDLVVAVKDNHGQDCIIAIDVTCDPTKEKSKLNTVQGKREDGDPSRFNRNQNLPSVRKELGIDKHIVLVVNYKHLPDPEVIINKFYAAANQPAKTRAINLHSYIAQVTLTDQVPSPQASAQASLSERNLTTLISTLERLPDREVVATIQRVQNYFANKPPQPPTQAERLAVQQEIDSLQNKIQSLWQRQGRQTETVEQMQKNPFRVWNQKYDTAFAELEHTMELIKETLTQKDQKQHQLQDWAKQHDTYQAWLNAPQTKQMQRVAEVLKVPQMQQRVATIHQAWQRQQQERQATYRQSQQQRDRGQGLSL